MNIENLKKKLDKHKLEKYLAYNAIPILYFEYACYGEVNNSFLKELNIKKFPTKIFTLGKTLEGWQDTPNWISLRDSRMINKIIRKNKDFVKENKSVFIEVKNKAKFTNKELIKALKNINKAVEGLYNSFVFFADECFETNDKDLVKILPKIRWEISTFVEGFAWAAYENILKNISENLGISRKIIDRSTTEELISVLNNEKTFEELKVTKDRPFGIILEGGGFYIIFNGQIQEIKDYLDEKDPLKELIDEANKTNQIKGMIAQKGIVRGEVIKLLEKDYPNAKEVLGGKEDYILVTPMTRPEIVQYMEKSLAIITDEGGITCHAAIVSREMNKPCIIGTKIATKVLKDGDLVEVDANKGVVKILKKND